MFTAPAYAQGTEAGPEAEAPDAPVTHSEVGVEHDAGSSFPPFDSSTFPSQLLWLAITFGLFYLFLKKVVLPRIGGILEVRQDRIAQDLGEAARLKEEADAAVAAYEQELAEARARANTIGQDARDGAKAKAEAERKEVEASLETKLSEAEARIALIKDAAMRDVGQIAEETAGSIVRELIGSDADNAAVKAAVKAARG
jgi:F-type H+-transporting ATPase subunit b